MVIYLIYGGKEILDRMILSMVFLRLLEENGALPDSISYISVPYKVALIRFKGGFVRASQR